MRDTDFAYAVARIRANELSLLSAADVEQIIAAPDEQAARHMMRDKGYADFGAKAEDTWQLLEEILPQPGLLDFLIVKHDFHNLKVLIKSTFAGSAPQPMLMRPSVYSPEDMAQALQNKRFDLLPECMAQYAETAYELMANTMDGQLADAVIDRQCLETTMAMASELRNAFVLQLADMMTAFADIKIALRAVRTGKGEDFLGKALCGSKGLPKQELIAACLEGGDALMDDLRESVYHEAAQAIETSGSAFEKYCDDALIGHVTEAGQDSFGIGPLIAFFLAREAEAKTLRIVLTAKQNGTPAEEIRKRARRLYV